MKIKEKYYRFAEKGQQIQRVNRFLVTEYLIFYAFYSVYALGIKSKRSTFFGLCGICQCDCSSLRRCIAHRMEVASGIGAAEISGTDRVISRIIFHDFCLYGELLSVFWDWLLLSAVFCFLIRNIPESAASVILY